MFLLNRKLQPILGDVEVPYLKQHFGEVDLSGYGCNAWRPNPVPTINTESQAKYKIVPARGDSRSKCGLATKRIWPITWTAWCTKGPSSLRLDRTVHPYNCRQALCKRWTCEAKSPQDRWCSNSAWISEAIVVSGWQGWKCTCSMLEDDSLTRTQQSSDLNPNVPPRPRRDAEAAVGLSI